VGPGGMSDRIRVFSGASANGEDAEACAVLEYTLRSNSSMPVDLEWMSLSRDSRSPFYSAPDLDEGWRTERWGSPFTALKWAVPFMCGYSGRAVYVDPDFVVRGDLADLWHLEMPPGTLVAARRFGGAFRFNVCIFDCGAFRARLGLELLDLQRNVGTHQELMEHFAQNRSLVQALDPFWHVLDTEIEGTIGAEVCAYHCSRMNLQPYMRHAVPRLLRAEREHWFTGTVLRHPNPRLESEFDALLAAAVGSGYGLERYTRGPLYGRYVLSGSLRQVAL